jgi:epidermal growth factor receptor substrate 15
MTNNAEIFDAYFRRADTDRDGRISGAEAVAFFQGANLPQVTLAKIWQFADQGRTGYLLRPEFYNALKLVTVGQTGRELSAELVKAALTGPAAAQIPPPRINPPGPSVVHGQVPLHSQHPPSALQGGIGGSATHPLSSQGSGGPQILQGQPQGWFPSVGNQMQVQTLPRPAPPTSAVQQPQVPLGSSYSATDSLWPTPRTPSFPSASQFLSSANVAPASSFQSMPTPSTTAHAQDSSGAPGFQASADLFSGGFKATGHRGSSLKIDAGGDFFSAAPPARPPGALPTKSTSPLQGFGDSSSLVDPVAPLALVPTTLAPAASLGKSPAVSQALPSLSMPQDLGPGLSARAFPGQGQGTPWLQMTANDVQRYMRVFSKVDTDRDGKITGEQARDLFLSWQLPREVLKQVWNLSDQDGDSMLSTREFCTALYFMERFREGQTLPATLPSHIHLDDWNLPGVPDGPKTGPNLPANYGETGWQQMQGNSQSTASGRAFGLLPDQSLAGHPELGTHALFSGFNSVKQGHDSETVVPRTKLGDVDEAKKKVSLIPYFLLGCHSCLS